MVVVERLTTDLVSTGNALVTRTFVRPDAAAGVTSASVDRVAGPLAAPIVIVAGTVNAIARVLI